MNSVRQPRIICKPSEFIFPSRMLTAYHSPAMSTVTFEREYLLPTLIKIGSPRLRRFVVDRIPWKKYRKLRDIINTMDRFIVNLFEEKKRALVKGNEAFAKQTGGAKDIISILSQCWR